MKKANNTSEQTDLTLALEQIVDCLFTVNSHSSAGTDRDKGDRLQIMKKVKKVGNSDDEVNLGGMDRNCVRGVMQTFLVDYTRKVEQNYGKGASGNLLPLCKFMLVIGHSPNGKRNWSQVERQLYIEAEKALADHLLELSGYGKVSVSKE